MRINICKGVFFFCLMIISGYATGAGNPGQSLEQLLNTALDRNERALNTIKTRNARIAQLEAQLVALAEPGGQAAGKDAVIAAQNARIVGLEEQLRMVLVEVGELGQLMAQLVESKLPEAKANDLVDALMRLGQMQEQIMQQRGAVRGEGGLAADRGPVGLGPNKKGKEPAR